MGYPLANVYITDGKTTMIPLLMGKFTIIGHIQSDVGLPR